MTLIVSIHRILAACLERCDDIDVRDRDGKTPLLYATSARWCHRDTLQLLLERGADVSVVDHRYSRNALQVGGYQVRACEP